MVLKSILVNVKPAVVLSASPLNVVRSVESGPFDDVPVHGFDALEQALPHTGPTNTANPNMEITKLFLFILIRSLAHVTRDRVSTTPDSLFRFRMFYRFENLLFEEAYNLCEQKQENAVFASVLG